MSAAAHACPRCGAATAASQEYCVDCGVRLPRVGRFGPRPAPERALALPLLLTLGVAAGGAGTAIALTRGSGAAPPPIIATGGSVRVTTAVARRALAVWPTGVDAWSIVLASIPKQQGQSAARAIADAAGRRELPRIGILDSDRYASLHPGYWVVFTGVYETEPDAAGVLQRARAVVKTARVQRVAP